MPKYAKKMPKKCQKNAKKMLDQGIVAVLD